MSIGSLMNRSLFNTSNAHPALEIPTVRNLVTSIFNGIQKDEELSLAYAKKEIFINLEKNNVIILCTLDSDAMSKGVDLFDLSEKTRDLFTKELNQLEAPTNSSRQSSRLIYPSMNAAELTYKQTSSHTGYHGFRFNQAPADISICISDVLPAEYETYEKALSD